MLLRSFLDDPETILFALIITCIILFISVKPAPSCCTDSPKRHVIQTLRIKCTRQNIFVTIVPVKCITGIGSLSFVNSVRILHLVDRVDLF